MLRPIIKMILIALLFLPAVNIAYAEGDTIIIHNNTAQKFLVSTTPDDIDMMLLFEKATITVKPNDLSRVKIQMYINQTVNVTIECKVTPGEKYTMKELIQEHYGPAAAYIDRAFLDRV
jgi:hypothetical protein